MPTLVVYSVFKKLLTIKGTYIDCCWCSLLFANQWIGTQCAEYIHYISFVCVTRGVDFIAWSHIDCFTSVDYKLNLWLNGDSLIEQLMDELIHRAIGEVCRVLLDVLDLFGPDIAWKLKEFWRYMYSERHEAELIQCIMTSENCYCLNRFHYMNVEWS